MASNPLYFTTSPDGCLDPINRFNLPNSKASHVYFSESDSKNGQDSVRKESIGIADVEVSLVEQYAKVSKTLNKDDGTVSEQVEELEDAKKLRPPQNIIDLFKEAVSIRGDQLALLAKRPIADTALEWKSWTWKQYWDDSYLFAKALLNIGVVPFGVINIIGENSPEWLISNNGAILAGCISAGIYQNSTNSACQYFASFSKAEVIVLQDRNQLKKFEENIVALSFLKAIVIWTSEDTEKALIEPTNSPAKIYNWEEFLLLGSAINDTSINTRMESIKPGNCSTVIFTSGTTGPPKAVMLSHDNITWTLDNLMQSYKEIGSNERVLSYLPLSHIAAQMIDIYLMMKIGGIAYFYQQDVLKNSLVLSIKEVKPTLFFAVPRVWEKIYTKIKDIENERKGFKKFVFNLARKVGADHSKNSQFGSKKTQSLSYLLTNTFFFNYLKKKLGFQETKLFITGSAPIEKKVLEYLASIDIPVFEVFGLTETTGPFTASSVDAWKIGFCGRPMKGTEVKLNGETGELLVKGRNVFMGYMYNHESTADAFDENGFFKTGDAAVFDDNNDPDIPPPSGFLKIVGRLKELIVTSGGENVAPSLIESEMKTCMPGVCDCIILGDGKKFLSMMVSLEVYPDSVTGLPSDNLTKEVVDIGVSIGSNATTYTQVKSDPLWKKYIDDGMALTNSITLSNTQKVQKWVWLPHCFTEQTEELNALLKMKRKVILQKYSDLIESIYSESPEQVISSVVLI